MNDDKKSIRWMNTWAYRKAQTAVSFLLNSPKKLLDLLEKVSQKSDKQASGTLGKTFDSIKVLVRLVSAYAKGRYREVGMEKLAMIVAALVYFVMPLDALPDFIALFGLTDDVALLAWTWTAVKGEVERFLEWELEQESTDSEIPPSDINSDT